MTASNNDSMQTVWNFFNIENCKLLNQMSETSDGTTTWRVMLEYCGETPDICPKCKEKMYSHGTRTITVCDTPMGGLPVKLNIQYHRYRCKNCGYIWQPEFKSINQKRMVTKRAYIDIAKKSMGLTFRQVARDYNISHVSIKNIFINYIDENREKMKFQTPMFLGIDEIKIKGLGEITVITDLERKTLFDLILGRNQTVLINYFMKLENREQVLWVCSDMYRPFEKCIKDTMPKARWVIDHFHVVMKANEAIDTIRRKLQGNMTNQQRIKTKRGLAYTLKTREKDLKPGEAAAIQALRADPTLNVLATAFDLKEDLFNIWEATSKDNAKQDFENWKATIPNDEIFEPFRELTKTITNFNTQIFNYWECPLAITNGFTEACNRMIREKNAIGRGYSFDVLRARSLYKNYDFDKDRNALINQAGPSLSSSAPILTTEAKVLDEDEEVDDNNI